MLKCIESIKQVFLLIRIMLVLLLVIVAMFLDSLKNFFKVTNYDNCYIPTLVLQLCNQSIEEIV
jgi:hypothetical protein